jgi:ABC-type antimicrobial peptide transport system permease subunit
MPERRNYVAALIAFALAASLLAVVGLHAAMAYEVHGRTDEIAVRKVLGARAWDLVATLGRPALIVTVAGTLAGLAGALALTPLLAPQLWGVTAADPLTLASTGLALAGTALVGGLVPIRRGLTVDPAVRLRSE